MMHYAMQDYAMLMLQLEVNISSSQGFSLVNLSQAYTKDYMLVPLIIFLLSLFHGSTVPYVRSFGDLN